MKEIYNVIKNDRPTDELVWKCNIEDFNNYSKLIVMESEEALVVKDGVIVDIISGEKYELKTGNIPFISDLRNKLSGGISPFSCQIYFIDITEKIGLYWGTGSDFYHSQLQKIHIGANGTYGIKIFNSKMFFNKLVGNIKSMSVENVIDLIKSKIDGTVIREVKAKINRARDIEEVLEIYNNISVDNDLINTIREVIEKELKDYGIELVDFTRVDIYLRGEQLDQILINRGTNIMNKETWGTETAGEAIGRKKILEIMEKMAENPNPGFNNLSGMGVGGIVNNSMSSSEGIVNMTKMFFEQSNETQKNNSTNNEKQSIEEDFTPIKAETEKICPNCKASVPEKSKFCSNCGHKFKEMICPNCGKKISNDTNFCSNCGAKL